MRRSFLVWTIFCAFLGFTPSLTSLPAYAQTDIAVYSDALGSGWQNWSWGTTLDFAATSPVHSGSKSLSARYDSGYVGLYFSFPSQVDTRYYSALTFYIHGGTTGNQSIDVHGARSGNFQGGVRIGGANIEGGSIVAQSHFAANHALNRRRHRLFRHLSSRGNRGRTAYLLCGRCSPDFDCSPFRCQHQCQSLSNSAKDRFSNRRRQLSDLG